MQNKPGPRKKPGERYPSGDLKPTVAPALWGRVRRGGDPQLSSELARLCFNRELTETQAAAGFRIADIYRSGDSADSLDDRRGVAAASEPINPRAAPDRIALDRLLSEYPPKVREAVIELCVSNRTVDWRLRPEIRQLLDHVARAFAITVGKRSKRAWSDKTERRRSITITSSLECRQSRLAPLPAASWSTDPLGASGMTSQAPDSTKACLSWSS